MTQKRPENTITLEQFARHFSEQESERFCFILGAGASKSSGIPTGAELSLLWLREIEQDLDAVTFTEWLESEKIDKNTPAHHYSKIFGKRFEASIQGGLDCLEKVMRKSNPSCGYSFLAEIMARGKHNVVITTNFDSLTEDALFIFTSKKPLVVGHSSLSEFINVQSTRPQVIKIHHDLFLSPKNTNSETREMGEKLKSSLKEIFKHYTPIVIGYGGNDGGFMELLQDSLSEDGRLFWCLMEVEESPRKDIEKLVISKNGHFIPIDGFDELMVFIGDRMGFKLLHERIETVANERITKYKEQFESVGRNIAERKDNRSIKNSLSEIISRIGKSPWAFELLAQQETDTKRKEKIYKRGLDEFPENYEPMSGYAGFLHYTRKSLEAEKYYKKALELEPENAAINGNYANFLKSIKKDNDEAEKYHKKALELEPEGATFNGNYAVFLQDIKKNSDEAEEYHKKALELEPEDATFNGNYAVFLQNIKKDSNEAEKYYKKALELKPEDAAINRNYAIFLQYTKKDNDEAEKYYKKALELKPEDAAINGNYANFLQNIKKDNDEVEKYYKKALELEPENATFNGNYANFLQYIKKDSDEAEKYHKKALELEPKNATFNGNYANFLQHIKKDNDEAEKYYKKALEFGPKDAVIFSNYAHFLLNIKKNSDEAEKYYKKALKLKPEDANINGSYALFLLQRGQLKEAKEFIDKAFHYNQIDEDEVLKLELWFYRYACFYKDYPESRAQVTRLLNDGIRSPGWNLTDLVEKVGEMRHPEYAQVVKFANQISAP